MKKIIIDKSSNTLWKEALEGVFFLLGGERAGGRARERAVGKAHTYTYVHMRTSTHERKQVRMFGFGVKI